MNLKNAIYQPSVVGCSERLRAKLHNIVYYGDEDWPHVELAPSYEDPHQRTTARGRPAIPLQS